MFRYFIFFVLWAACSADCDVTSSTCMQKERYNSDLDLALDLLVKSKYPLPKDWSPKALDCADVLKMGSKQSGLYEIWPLNRLTDGEESLSVYCDMDTDGGGWTVIQRRGDFDLPEDYFYRDWKSYKEGFGDREKEFWLGNDNIFALTNQKLYSVRFDYRYASSQNKKYAVFDKFWIDDEDHKYTLHISEYSGDAGDSMTDLNNQAFSTKDQDNDRYNDINCAVSYSAAWWYADCGTCNLNGLNEKGDFWYHLFQDMSDILEWAEIKIRPKNFRTSLASGIAYNL